MISNTVIVFLRDLLPVFILYAFVSTMSLPALRHHHFSWRLVSILSLLATLVVFFNIEFISERFDGAGIEIFYSISIALAWLCLLLANELGHFVYLRSASLLMSIGIVLFTLIKGVEFCIYFGVFGLSEDKLISLFLACILGLGICVSFAVLLKFILTEIQQSSAQRWLLNVLWYAFLAGQLSQIIGLLSQIGIIDGGPPLFEFGQYITDASEYGHLLNALLGYESSPNVTFLWVYVLAISLPLIARTLLHKHLLPSSLEGTR